MSPIGMAWKVPTRIIIKPRVIIRTGMSPIGMAGRFPTRVIIEPRG